MDDISELLLRANFISEPLKEGPSKTSGSLRELVIAIGSNFEIYEMLMSNFCVPSCEGKQNLLRVDGAWVPIAVQGSISENILSLMIECGLIEKIKGQPKFRLVDARKDLKFLDGDWFEEYTRLAALEAGADKAISSVMIYPSELIGPKKKDKTDLDVIVRKGDKYLFISNKRRASHPNRQIANRKKNIFAAYKIATRDLSSIRGMMPRNVDIEYVLAITSDMIDELNGKKQRYPHFYDYAENQYSIKLLTLDKMSWFDYVNSIKELIEA